METAINLLTLAIVFINVSLVLIVLNLRNTNKKIDLNKVAADGQFRIVSRGIQKLNEKVETGQEEQKVFFNVNPVEKLTTEELIAALNKVFEYNKPKEPSFAELLAAHFKEEEELQQAKLAHWKAKSEANAAKAQQEVYETPKKYILGADITPAEVEKMSKEDAEQVLREYATEKTIEAAEQIVKQKKAKKPSGLSKIEPSTIEDDKN
jgi:hypothetical protein